MGLIDVLPDVDAGCAATAQPLRRADQHQAVPAADVEHLLIAAPRNRVQQRVAGAEFSNQAAPEQQQRPETGAPAH